MGLLSNANAVNHAIAARELRAAGKRAQEPAAPPLDDSLVRQLLWEQRSTNRMLWALLNDEQRRAYEPPPAP